MIRQKKINKLWGLSQYKSDIDTSMLNADQKTSFKEMKKKWGLSVSKKGKLTYDIVPIEKMAANNAQTSDSANENTDKYSDALHRRRAGYHYRP